MTPSSSAAQRPQALSILLKASSLLLDATSEEELLSQTLDFASNLLTADAYGVWRQMEDEGAWRIVAQRGLSASYPRSVTMHPGAHPQTVWTMEDIVADSRAAFDRSTYLAEGIRSAMVIPWTLGSAVTGAIIYYCRQPRKFSQDDVDYAVALSNLSASALNRLELRRQNQLEKQRLSFLAEASVMLASSLDYESTLHRVAQLAVSRIAEWCTVHVVEEGKVTRLVVAHTDPALAPLAEQYSLKYPEEIVPESGLGKLLRTGEPEMVPVVTDEMVQHAAIDAEHLEMLRRFQLSASILVPLQSQGKVLGAIRLLGTGGHTFGPGDLQLALDLGRRAGVAVENARLHRVLVEQAAELRLSHAAAKMGSWSWDLENGKLTWSSEFKTLHGLPQDVEPSPERSYDLVHPEDRERARKEFWEIVNSSAEVFHSEHRVLMPDGRLLWLQVRGRIRRNAEGKATWVAGLIIDVTDSHLAEQALRRAEKLAAAGRLAATVAHEVNNPLASLVNLIYLAQQTEGLPAEASRHLHMADDELRRIAQIVRQTLGFYRESTVPRSTEIRSLVAEVLELYQARGASRGILLRAADTSDQQIYATVIAGEIKQIVANLVANAIDATPAHGKVETCVQRLDGCVEIAVSDTGSGIAEAHRKHLFEPFFTTKDDVGTGLGLWVSKGIAEKHGGTISVDDSAAAAGTTFRIRLPL